MIDDKESESPDNRAVSPVIGVILMVAITVILAAVIGTFVLGLGDSLNQAPQAQISIEAAGNGGSVVISHDGGDAMTASDLTVSTDSSSINFEDQYDNDEFSVGDPATFTNNIDSQDSLTVQLIHEPSESVIAESTVDTNP